MGWTSTALTFGLAFLLAGCGASTPEGSAAYECTPQIRMNGKIYNGYGYTDRRATESASADEADCHDEGLEAPGSAFPDDPRQVAVWSFADYSSEQVVGVRFGQDSFAVYIAQSMPRDAAEQIARELRAD